MKRRAIAGPVVTLGLPLLAAGSAACRTAEAPGTPGAGRRGRRSADPR